MSRRGLVKTLTVRREAPAAEFDLKRLHEFYLGRVSQRAFFGVFCLRTLVGKLEA